MIYILHQPSSILHHYFHLVQNKHPKKTASKLSTNCQLSILNSKPPPLHPHHIVIPAKPTKASPKHKIRQGFWEKNMFGSHPTSTK